MTPWTAWWLRDAAEEFRALFLRLGYDAWAADIRAWAVAERLAKTIAEYQAMWSHRYD